MIKGARKPGQYHRDGRVMEGNGGTRIRDHRPTLSLSLGSTNEETSDGSDEAGEEEATEEQKGARERGRNEQDSAGQKLRIEDGRSACSFFAVKWTGLIGVAPESVDQSALGPPGFSAVPGWY